MVRSAYVCCCVLRRPSPAWHSHSLPPTLFVYPPHPADGPARVDGLPVVPQRAPADVAGSVFREAGQGRGQVRRRGLRHPQLGQSQVFQRPSGGYTPVPNCFAWLVTQSLKPLKGTEASLHGYCTISSFFFFSVFVCPCPCPCPCRCSVPDRWSAAKSKASEWGAWVEVMFGMILVAELLLPRRSVRKVPLELCHIKATVDVCPFLVFPRSLLDIFRTCFERVGVKCSQGKELAG